MAETTNSPELTGPIHFRMLLDKAMNLTRRHFRRLFLPFALPIAVVTGVFSLGYTTFLQRITTAGASNPKDLFGGSFLFMGCSAVLLMIVLFFSYSALWAACAVAVSGRPLSIGDQWKFVFRPGVFGTLLLSVVAVLAGLVLFVAPGIYVALLLALIVPVMVIEGERGVEALRRSITLVRYNPKEAFLAAPIVKVFVLWLASIPISWGLSAPVQLPYSVLNVVLSFREAGAVGGFEGPLLWLMVPTQVLSALVGVIVQMYFAMGVALLYTDIRYRRSGLDLVSALDSIAAPPQTEPPLPGFSTS